MLRSSKSATLNIDGWTSSAPAKPGAADRRRRLARARAGRGAGPDRRIRRRQVDHRPRGARLWARRLPHRRRRGRCSTARTSWQLAGRQVRELRGAPRRLRGAVGRRRLQSGAQLIEPARRSAGPARRDGARRGASSTRRRACSPRLGLPEPETFGKPLSAPGLGRPAAARHDRHGAVPASPT